jgi:hypothetical protein
MEVNLQLLDDFSEWRFVRMTNSWEFPHRPVARSMQDAIVVGYTVLQKGGIGRVFYVMATADVVDGLQLDPGTVHDPHNGICVVPRTVACETVPMPYAYHADEFADKVRRHRAAHVGFWELQRKLRPKPEKPGFIARLLGGKA